MAAANCTILLLEDEPIILMDLEFAAEDRGCRALAASTCAGALERIEAGQGAGADELDAIDVAVLDVSLEAGGETCLPVARALDEHGIPYLLHSADLDRHDEQIRELDAELIAKPAAAADVIAAAIRRCARCGGD